MLQGVLAPEADVGAEAFWQRQGFLSFSVCEAGILAQCLLMRSGMGA